MIREATIRDSEVLSNIISASFHDVARRFSLTRDNCPKHPSNCTSSWIEADIERGVRFFILNHDGNSIGCVGVESPGSDVCYLERLSVLPGMRGKHFGVSLVRHALDHAASRGACKVSIGIISEQTELKDWYKRLGFTEIGTKRFPHLPFQVCFMEIENLRSTSGQTATTNF
jgi:N-acetylglutamate synthase-like GNAT family acetyltransferase